MAQGLDEVEKAIHSIRKISRLADLEQVQAILTAKRVELISRSARVQGGGLSTSGKSAPAPASRPAAKPKGPNQPGSTLDPAHRQDPAYIEYCKALEAMTRYCAEHKVPRTQVPPAVRDPFQRALDAWMVVKPKYKTSGLTPFLPLNAGANGAVQVPVAGGDKTAQSSGSTP